MADGPRNQHVVELADATGDLNVIETSTIGSSTPAD
jgi:hypothetical protein